MNKEQAKTALIELYEGQIMDLTLMSKIELGDDVIAEIKKLKNIINKKENDPRDIKYGLIVVDPNEEADMLSILHFAGYWEEPTQVDIDSLRKELVEDESFGLTLHMDQLEILPAPQYIVDQYVKDIIENATN
jgi:hypothetical protein